MKYILALLLVFSSLTAYSGTVIVCDDKGKCEVIIVID